MPWCSENSSTASDESVTEKGRQLLIINYQSPLAAVARVSTCYPDKFGAPRQSGLVPDSRARLVFEPPFRHPDAVRGLEGFSHLWLVWVFSENVDKGWSPTVRPPRLGGNVRMGVFATRAPFRPNPIGLSAVRLERVELHPLDGPVLHLSGVDLVDGTPILDIKPYVPLADCIPEASEGFTAVPCERLDVEIPESFGGSMSPEGEECAGRYAVPGSPSPVSG